MSSDRLRELIEEGLHALLDAAPVVSARADELREALSLAEINHANERYEQERIVSRAATLIR